MSRVFVDTNALVYADQAAASFHQRSRAALARLEQQRGRSVHQLTGGGKQVHDANLVATMLANGIDQILTFNDADLRRFGTLIALAAPQPGSVANA